MYIQLTKALNNTKFLPFDVEGGWGRNAASKATTVVRYPCTENKNKLQVISPET